MAIYLNPWQSGIVDKVMKYCLIVLIAVIASCSNQDKLSCYESYLTSIKKKEVYVKLMNQARESVPHVRREKGQSIFKESSYIDSAVLDDAVFFNNARTKCILLVLQQTSGSLRRSGFYYSRYISEWRMAVFDKQAAIRAGYVCDRR